MIAFFIPSQRFPPPGTQRRVKEKTLPCQKWLNEKYNNTKRIEVQSPEAVTLPGTGGLSELERLLIDTSLVVHFAPESRVQALRIRI